MQERDHRLGSGFWWQGDFLEQGMGACTDHGASAGLSRLWGFGVE